MNLPTGATITTGQNITRTGAWKSNTANETTTYTWDTSTTADCADGKEYTHDSTENTITFADISAHELFYKYTIPVTLGEQSYTVTVSPMSYVKGMLEFVKTVDVENLTLTDVMKNILFTEAEQNNTTTVTVENAKERATNLKNAVIALYNYYAETCNYKGMTPITGTTSSTGTGDGQ